MEGVKTFWLVNSIYNNVKEFHFVSDILSFVAYTKDNKPIFILDNTCDAVSPNNLLIIEPMPEDIDAKAPKTKWDSILKIKYNIDPIKVRPKENTKYKKLDISYSDLSLYEKFITNQTDELLDSITEKREILSLNNAYERESENLLNYNKSTQTIEKATITLENLRKKISHISKRLKKQQELESINPEKINEVLKSELVKKLYDNTEKLKRTERRIKRAKKRSSNAFEDLSLNRLQIQEIRNRIEKRKNDSSSKNRILTKFNASDSLVVNDNGIKKDLQNQPVINKKIEELTIKNINANNTPRKEKEPDFTIKKEIDMAKETENKNVKTTTEFKPPFVDDTAQDVKTSDIKFAKKTDSFDDKYKKVWMYVASIMVSLIIVFGLFFFLSSDSNESYVDSSNYVEQNYQEATEEPAEESAEDIILEEEVSTPDTSDIQEEPASEPFVQQEVIPEPAPMPAQKVSEPKPVPVSKPTPVKTVSKPAPAKPVAKPIVEKEVVVEEELTNIPEEDDEEYIEEDAEYVEEEDDDVADYEESEKEETAKISTLELTKKEYVDNVLAGDEYLKLIAYLKDNFFTLTEDTKIAELEKMNHYWNDFRNATYDAYYESDYTLKSDINYEEYANDEYLLRVYTNAYFDFYEYIVNEFVMTYEYANNTATALYAAIENELDVLGRPLAKLEILARIYNAIQSQGGASEVLTAIAEKDETETIAENNMDVEASLIPLTATTEIVYQETIYSDNDTEIVNQDKTEISTDFEEEYSNSDDIITIDTEDDVSEVETTDSEDDVSEEVAVSEDSEDNVDESDTEDIADSMQAINDENEEDSDEEVADNEQEEFTEDESDSVETSSIPSDLEIVAEDDSEEIASIEPTETEENEDTEENSDEEVADDEYYEDDENDVEYSDSEEDVVIEEI